MFKLVGAVGVFMLVSAIGSEWHPKPNLHNAFWALVSAAMIGSTIGSIADSLRALASQNRRDAE